MPNWRTSPSTVASPFGANRGHVVERHRQVLVDQGAQQRGDHAVDRILVVHQCVHAAQQLLMREFRDLDIGQGHRLHPAQDAQLGFRVAQPVEHHDANQGLDVDGVAGAAKDAAQIREAQFLPQLGQRPHVAQRAGGLKRQRRGGQHRCRARLGRHRLAAGHLEQAIDDGIELAGQLIHAPQRGDGALLHPPGVVAIGLDKLDVATRTGGGDLDEHAATVSHQFTNPNNRPITENVPPQKVHQQICKSLILQKSRGNWRREMSNSGGPGHTFGQNRQRMAQIDHLIEPGAEEIVRGHRHKPRRISQELNAITAVSGRLGYPSMGRKLSIHAGLRDIAGPTTSSMRPPSSAPS
jgi:hypothetical protein